MNIYLAGRYSRREELCRYREELRAMGHIVRARWLDGEHQIANDGKPIGEHGESLVEGKLRSGEQLSEQEQSDRAAKLRSRFAIDDLEDVSAAELIINFTEPPRTKATRGGRHVEYGIALANGAFCILVGPRENIFHWLPGTACFETWEEAKAILPPATEFPADVPGTCKYCGCTETDPCAHENGDACHWADEHQTVCSVCAGSTTTKSPMIAGLQMLSALLQGAESEAAIGLQGGLTKAAVAACYEPQEDETECAFPAADSFMVAFGLLKSIQRRLPAVLRTMRKAEAEARNKEAA